MWSSYKYYMGREFPPVYLDRSTTLSYFNNSADQYRGFVEEGLIREVKNPLEEATGVVLGSEKFIDMLRGKYLIDVQRDSQIIGLNETKGPEIDPENIIGILDETKGINCKEADKLKIYFLHKYTDYTLRDIGEKVKGKRMRTQTVGQIVSRFKEEILNNGWKRELVDRLESKMWNVER